MSALDQELTLGQFGGTSAEIMRHDPKRHHAPRSGTPLAG